MIRATAVQVPRHGDDGAVVHFDNPTTRGIPAWVPVEDVDRAFALAEAWNDLQEDAAYLLGVAEQTDLACEKRLADIRGRLGDWT